MIGILLVLVFGAASYLVPRSVLTPSRETQRFALWMLLGFVLRILAHGVIRNVRLFSHGASSHADAGMYELGAWTVARLWEYQGFGWYDAEEIGITEVGNALLAVHIFAGITFLNGGEMTTLGCTSVNALIAVLTCLQLVKLGTMIKGAERDARLVALAMYFSPAYVFHTADMFKDGLSAFLVVSAVLLSFRLSERFSPIDAVLGVICLVLVWYVRFYLVFLVSAPLVMSLLGIRSGSTSRVVLAGAFMLAGALLLIGTQFAEDALDVGMAPFDRAPGDNALAYNAAGGSGVEFAGSPWVTFPQKLVYTLLSPFPWDFRSTSIGFQVGKIDALIWAFFLFRGIRGARRMWHDDRGTLLMFLVVLVPLTVAYATTMANIGLILRQRFPIVLLGAVLAVRGTRLRRNQRRAAEEQIGQASTHPVIA